MRNDSSFWIEDKGYLPNEEYDDDGREKRTGTWKSAATHIITAVIGSGVLSLSWCYAQLGWVAGTIIMVSFASITMFTSYLMADCYRSPDPVTGKRNYTYMEAVKANLGMFHYKLCGVAQYAILIGITIGYTTTTAISMAAINKSNCFHKEGHKADCRVHNNPFMILFAVFQVILSQVPNFDKLEPISVIAAVMSFTYSLIGIGLSIAKIVEDGMGKTTLTGIPVRPDFSAEEKFWAILAALGDIAFSYSFCFVLIEIQDTLKSSPPENKQMKIATVTGIMTSNMFYMLCAALGYAAFGINAPGNFLTGFGFYEPFWLVDIANLCIAVHLIGAYQVLAQPFFMFVDNWSIKQWPENKFIKMNFSLWGYELNMYRLIWRTCYVIVTTIIAMLFPFFNDFVGLLGASTFWPLSIYFPLEMYIARAKIRRYSFSWNCMQILSLICFIVSLVAAVGSTRGLIASLKKYEAFNSVS